MTIAYISSSKGASSDGNTWTTPTFDSSGANFLVFCVAYYNPTGVTVTHNKGGTVHMLTANDQANFDTACIGYVEGMTGGTGHTITLTGLVSYSSICWAWYSGVKSSGSFDQQPDTSGGGVGEFGGAIGNIVPSEDGELLILGSTHQVSDTTSSLTELQDQVFVGGIAFGSSLAHQIQTTATNRNPTVTGSDAATGACFKAEPAGATTPPPKTTFVNIQAVQRATTR